MNRTAHFHFFLYLKPHQARLRHKTPSTLRKLTAILMNGGLCGTLWLASLSANATVISAGNTVSIGDPAQLGPGDIDFQGGTLEVTADGSFLHDQTLRVGAQGGTIAAASGKALDLAGGLVVQDGIVRFGNASNAGTISIGIVPYADTSGTGEVHVDAGTLKGVANTYGLSQLLYGARVVSVAAGATLDLAGSAPFIRNLQGAGRLELGSTGTPLSVVEGNFSGVISGDRALSKTGNTRLVLSGTNTYTGGTEIIESSVLSVSRDANLGAASGRLYISGSTLQVTGTAFSQMVRNVEIGPLGATLDIADAGNRFILGSAVSGTGDLAKEGDGVLVLANSGNAYRNTTVWRGTLEGSTRTIRGNLINIATVVLNEPTDSYFAGDISGAGLIIKTGAGFLRLNNNNAYQQWRILEGGVVFTSNSTGIWPIEIGAAGTLLYETDDEGSIFGPLSGTGLLRKRGSGELAIIGDSSAFSGRTQVEAGRLVILRDSKLGGTLEISSGATLEGTGTVGTTTIAAGGTIEMGRQYGTLTVQGDLTMQPGSTYLVKAYPVPKSTYSDRIVVRGTANLGGAVLHVGPEGNFQPAQTYTILTADRINGTFARASSSYAYLEPSLGYTDKAVTLQLARRQEDSREVSFASAAQTSNQRNVANVLDRLPESNPLRQYVLTLPEGAPAGVFDSLSGEAHASMAASLAATSLNVRGVPFKHLRVNLGAGMAPGTPTAQAGDGVMASALPSSMAQPAWAEVVGNWQTFKGDGNVGRVTQNTGGVFVGADHAAGAGWRIGGALGFTDGRMKVDDRASKARVGSYTAMLYGGRSVQAGPGKLNLLLGASYTWNDIGTLSLIHI